jgi:hypothetical protein
MLIGFVVIVAAGVGAALAGYILWWAAHRSGLWNLFAGILLGLAAFAAALLIGYLMMRASSPF